MTHAPKLDWISRHDPRSRNYPVRALVGPVGTVRRRFKAWSVGPVLDQGREGACVGHGFTNEATASPVRVDLTRVAMGPEWPRDPQAFAFALYNWCRRNDQYPGEDYDGTAVLTGAQGMKMLGLFKEYRWAFSMDDLIDALILKGPAVLGIDWCEGMYDAPGGELRATGPVVGGHCILAVGYDPAHLFHDGTQGEAILLFNSWGSSWGIGGLAWIRVSDLAVLLRNGGEACIPVHRSYGRPTTRRQRIAAAASCALKSLRGKLAA